MRLEIASNAAISYSCKNFHYSKSVPVCPFGISCFNDNGEWCGCIIYSRGANNNAGLPFGLQNGEFAELTRVALNGKQEYTSKYLAKSLKFFKAKAPLVKLVISYADIDQSHLGIIYQATNWYYIGDVLLNKLDGSYLINGKRIHGKTISSVCGSHTMEKMAEHYKTTDIIPYRTKGKHKYLFPLRHSMVSICKSKQKPYPKLTNSVTDIKAQPNV